MGNSYNYLSAARAATAAAAAAPAGAVAAAATARAATARAAHIITNYQVQIVLEALH